MAHVSDLIATDIGRYLEAHEHKSLLRFITCGSVDDGKSTLIGRLLYDSKMIYEDQLAALAATRRRAAPRSASSASATSSTSGTPRTSGRSCGTSITPARTRAKASACSRFPTGPNSTSGNISI